MNQISSFFVIICLIEINFVISSSTQKPYIHGGHKAKAREFPYIAFIRIWIPKENSFSECTGSIIGDHWVLTAAHCLQNHSASYISIWVGDSTKTDGEKFRAEVIHILPGQNGRCIPSNDIGLIKTDKKFEYGRKISPISLYPHPSVDADLPLQVASFGCIQDGERSERLQSVKQLRQLPFQQCREIVGRTIPEAFRCFTGDDVVLCTFTPGIAFLPGDSGAGIVVQQGDRKFLVAVASASGGSIAKARTFPSIATKVYRHLGWITRRTGIRT